MRYFILVPDLSKPGGVANYYKAIRPFLPNEIEYFVRGTRKGVGKIGNMMIFIFDFLRFYLRISKSTVVVINNSFGNSSILRDSKFAKICVQKNVPFIIFFRGWDKNFENILLSNSGKRKIFEDTLLKASKILVLSSEFKTFIEKLGYKGEIIIETTTVEQVLINKYNADLSDKRIKSETKTLLFLSRLEENKGVYKAIELQQELRKKFTNIELDIAGVGKAEKDVKTYIDTNKLEGINLLGYVRDKAKLEAYKKAYLFLFLSSHGEGMPNSVLEAMAMGLPIVSSKVGGLKDICTHKNGFFYDDYDSKANQKFVSDLIKDEEKYKTISDFNRNDAETKFSARVVAERLTKIIKAIS